MLRRSTETAEKEIKVTVLRKPSYCMQWAYTVFQKQVAESFPFKQYGNQEPTSKELLLSLLFFFFFGERFAKGKIDFSNQHNSSFIAKPFLSPDQVEVQAGKLNDGYVMGGTPSQEEAFVQHNFVVGTT